MELLTVINRKDHSTASFPVNRIDCISGLKAGHAQIIAGRAVVETTESYPEVMTMYRELAGLSK